MNTGPDLNTEKENDRNYSYNFFAQVSIQRGLKRRGNIKPNNWLNYMTVLNYFYFESNGLGVSTGTSQRTLKGAKYTRRHF